MINALKHLHFKIYLYASKEWNQTVYENKFQVVYVNEKYDQCEHASDFSSVLLYDH
jgi:hypothetical protein